jgi:hypothetical protein
LLKHSWMIQPLIQQNFILTSTVTPCFFLFNFAMSLRSQSSISEFSQIWLLRKYGRKEF